MRSFVVAVFALLSLSISAGAQDAAQMAAQQATQAAQQANQQAMQAAQQASQQAIDDAMRANQQAVQNMDDATLSAQQNTCCTPQYTSVPSFSLKAGKYPAGTVVRLTDSSRDAVMYYTTDGWTPTTKSTRYTGPITLTQTSTLQAIAVAPYLRTSLVSTAAYTVPGTQPAVANGPEQLAVLAPGTMLSVMFNSAVSSKGLQIGDKLPVVLAQDLDVGGVLVAPKLTPVLTTVMGVDQPGAGGAPGSIAFEAHSITLTNGETIPLAGTESKQGAMRMKTVRSLFFVPVVGMGALLIHGDDAQIPKGATFTAYVKSGASPSLSAKTTQPQPPSTTGASPQ